MAMETVVAFAIGVLATVFVGSLVILVVICRRYGSFRLSALNFGKSSSEESRPDKSLIKEEDDGSVLANNAQYCYPNEVELGEVCLDPDLEKILWEAEEEGGQWIGDASGLIPHCLTILRTCHLLIHCLAPLAASSSDRKLTHQIQEVAQLISPRVDDVVRSMYPPLDPIVLEARVSTLVFAVRHLSDLVLWHKPKTQMQHNGKSCRSNKNKLNYDWVTHILTGVDSHLLALREASLSHEAQNHILSSLP